MPHSLSLDVYQDPYWEMEQENEDPSTDDDGWEDAVLEEYRRDEALWDFSDQPSEPRLLSKFKQLETPSPKLAHQISWEDELYHARFRLASKRCRGQKPRYKEKRRSQRFSQILLQHYMQTQKEWDDLDDQILVRNFDLYALDEALWSWEEELKHCSDPGKQLEIEIMLYELDMQAQHLAKAA